MHIHANIYIRHILVKILRISIKERGFKLKAVMTDDQPSDEHTSSSDSAAEIELTL